MSMVNDHQHYTRKRFPKLNLGIKSIMTTPIILNSFAKNPFLPSSGVYGTSFEAKVGLKRLISNSNRTRQAILNVIQAAALVDQDDELVERIYQAIGLLSSLDVNEAIVVGRVINSLPPPSEKSVKKISMTDNSGSMAAVMLMSGKTPSFSSYFIANFHGLFAKPKNTYNPIVNINLEKREKLINKIIEFANHGVPWEGDQLSNQLSQVLQEEGWHSSFAQHVVQNLNVFPYPLNRNILLNAPASLSVGVLHKALNCEKKAEEVVFLIEYQLQHQLDPPIAWDRTTISNLIERFITDHTIPASEKIKLYTSIIEKQDQFHPYIIKTVSKKLASLDNPETFSVAMSYFVKGLDLNAVAELTGNLDYALLDFKPIKNTLKKYNLEDQSDPEFTQFTNAMNAYENRELNVELSSGDGYFDASGEFNLSMFASSDMITIMKSGGSLKEHYNAILRAAIMIAVGIPVSIALLTTQVTAQELVSNPNIIHQGKRIVRSQNPSDRQQVEEAIAQFKKSPSNSNGLDKKPKNKSNYNSVEITRTLVDAIIALEYVPNKMFSSKGAGGVMQLMPATWEEVNQKSFQGKYPFDLYATNSIVNVQFGTQYLKNIKTYLDNRKDQWNADQLPLIFACYFGGIGNIRKANFDPDKIKELYPKTYSYMVRGSNLMDYDTSKL